MGRKRTPGIYKRYGVWHIDKQINGRRICESTGTVSLEEAEKYLAHRIESLRQASVYGIRPKRLFREAATKFLMENQHKASIKDDAYRLKVLVPFIGDLNLDSIHMGALQPFIEARRKDGIKTRTINHALQIVRRILNLASGEWIDEYGLTWLVTAPKIKLLPEPDLRKPYPLTWEEQDQLIRELPGHLARMALFAVNTGCRDQEVCNMRWEWMVVTPECTVFVIPGVHVKNRDDRLVVLNDVALSVVKEMQGNNSEFVFTYNGKQTKRMLNSAWLKARKRAGLPVVRVHDLKHTFGRRLRAAGVSFEDRQDLLGHRSARITTHYSSAELHNLYAAANKVSHEGKSGPVLTLLRTARVQQNDAATYAGISSRKNPAVEIAGLKKAL